MLWLGYARGRSSTVRSAAMLNELYDASGPAAHFRALYPARLSTDWQLYVMRALEAKRAGQPAPELSVHLLVKKDEATAFNRNMAAFETRFLEELRDRFADMPAFLVGSPILLHKLAAAGLKLGMEPGLGRGSRIRAGGGFKGAAMPTDFDATIRRFTGGAAIDETYGMSELMDAFRLCGHGRYHVWPWIIPFVFDIGAGALLPRHGTQVGRAAFVDLSAQTYWGGVVTGDRISLSWERCACGRTTPHIAPMISRIPTGDRDPYVLGGPTPNAMHAALHALNRDLDHGRDALRFRLMDA